MAQENKVYKQYHVDFSSKWISTSAFFAGLSFFILVAKYFGIENIKQVGFGEICFSMALPLLVLTVFGVLLRGFQFRVTPLYGILAALYCVLMGRKCNLRLWRRNHSGRFLCDDPGKPDCRHHRPLRQR